MSKSSIRITIIFTYFYREALSINRSGLRLLDRYGTNQSRTLRGLSGTLGSGLRSPMGFLRPYPKLD